MISSLDGCCVVGLMLKRLVLIFVFVPVVVAVVVAVVVVIVGAAL